MNDSQPFTRPMSWCVTQLSAPLTHTLSDTFTLHLLPASTANTSPVRTCAVRDGICRVTLLQRTPASKSNCAAPYITSPLWRLSGTGNSLLCIAVLLSRVVSALQSPRHYRVSCAGPDITANSCIHSCVLSFLPLRQNWLFQYSIHMAHLDPDPHRPTAHPSECPVQMNFSIGGNGVSGTSRWQRGCGCDWSTLHERMGEMRSGMRQRK